MRPLPSGNGCTALNAEYIHGAHIAVVARPARWVSSKTRIFSSSGRTQSGGQNSSSVCPDTIQVLVLLELAGDHGHSHPSEGAFVTLHCAPSSAEAMSSVSASIGFRGWIFRSIAPSGFVGVSLVAFVALPAFSILAGGTAATGYRRLTLSGWSVILPPWIRTTCWVRFRPETGDCRPIWPGGSTSRTSAWRS